MRTAETKENNKPTARGNHAMDFFKSVSHRQCRLQKEQSQYGLPLGLGLKLKKERFFFSSVEYETIIKVVGRKREKKNQRQRQNATRRRAQNLGFTSVSV